MLVIVYIEAPKNGGNQEAGLQKVVIGQISKISRN